MADTPARARYRAEWRTASSRRVRCMPNMPQCGRGGYASGRRAKHRYTFESRVSESSSGTGPRPEPCRNAAFRDALCSCDPHGIGSGKVRGQVAVGTLSAERLSMPCVTSTKCATTPNEFSRTLNDNVSHCVAEADLTDSVFSTQRRSSCDARLSKSNDCHLSRSL